MLKIKDNVDLKELKKYGFCLDKYGSEYYKHFKTTKYLIEISAFSRKGRICFYKRKYGLYFKRKIKKRFIKDLIKDGLIEKVEG